ncbi:MAG TPA: hypothetical protein VFQ45_08290 [Longimicrobium sp.]|nr:hypothetical protein [Longimicrobium sp.]
MEGSRQRYVGGFMRGMARALDLRGSVNARYAYAPRAPYPPDEVVAASDWAVVFGDLGQAYWRVRQRESPAHGQ